MDLDAEVTKFRKFIKEYEDLLARLKSGAHLPGAHPAVEGEPTEITPQGFFGGGGPSLPVAHDLEGLNEQIQGAGGVFDLSKIDIASFKNGFANLVHRLTATEDMLKRLAEATADLGEQITARLAGKPAEGGAQLVDAQGDPVKPGDA
jgi:hypothetical protein